MEPPNKGHFGNRSFVLCSEVVPISEVPLYNQIMFYIAIKCMICEHILNVEVMDTVIMECLTASGLV